MNQSQVMSISIMLPGRQVYSSCRDSTSASQLAPSMYSTQACADTPFVRPQFQISCVQRHSTSDDTIHKSSIFVPSLLAGLQQGCSSMAFDSSTHVATMRRVVAFGDRETPFATTVLHAAFIIRRTPLHHWQAKQKSG